MTEFFTSVSSKIAYEGPASDNPGWRTTFAKSIMNAEHSLESLREHVKSSAEPHRVSGRQEMLENTVARYVERAG